MNKSKIVASWCLEWPAHFCDIEIHEDGAYLLLDEANRKRLHDGENPEINLLRSIYLEENSIERNLHTYDFKISLNLVAKPMGSGRGLWIFDALKPGPP